MSPIGHSSERRLTMKNQLKVQPYDMKKSACESKLFHALISITVLGLTIGAVVVSMI